MDNHPVKQAIDVLSVATVAGTLAAWLPPIAAFFSIVWGIMRTYEGLTGRKFSESSFAKKARSIFGAD